MKTYDIQREQESMTHTHTYTQKKQSGQKKPTLS